ncbi:MAG: hypothetical protein AB1798_02085, partial [Spirochaetota bacterium]
YLKSWLLSFLWSIKKGAPEYHFKIQTGRGIREIESEEDIKKYALELSTLFFENDPKQFIPPGEADEVFIFMTAFDHHVTDVVKNYSTQKPFVFRTMLFDGNITESVTEFTVFKPSGMLFLPYTWILRKDNPKTTGSVKGILRGQAEEARLSVKII